MERKTLITLVFLAACAYACSQWVYSFAINGTSGWFDPVVTQGELETAKWAYANVPHQSVFACDMFACETLTATSFQIGAIGGAWELADRANERYMDNEKSFLSNSSVEAYNLMKKWNITYVFANTRSGFYAYGWKDANLNKFAESPEMFEKIYENQSTYIFKLK